MSLPARPSTLIGGDRDFVQVHHQIPFSIGLSSARYSAMLTGTTEPREQVNAVEVGLLSEK